MSIRQKLLLLLISIFCLLLFGLLLLRNVQQHDLAASSANAVEMHLTMAERIVALKSAPLLGMAKDYTFWDDMVAFVNAPDPQWARQNIDTGLETFNVDHAWVLRPDGTVVFTTAHNDSADPVALPLQLPQLIQRLRTDNPARFFVMTNNGLSEMVGASIHPTSDKTRVTAPAGYLLLEHTWDPSHLQELSAQVNAKLQLVDNQPPAAPDSGAAAGHIRTTLPLNGIDRQPVAWLQLDADSDFLADLHHSSQITFLWLVIASFVPLLVTAIVLNFTVNRPLQQLTSAMQNESVASLDKLQEAPHEFGKFAQLLTQFFIQKRHLEAEIAERDITTTALRASEFKFNQIFDNVPVGLVTLDDQLHIVHPNIAAQKLTGYLRNELQGEHISLLLHPDDQDAALLPFKDICADQRRFHRSLVRLLHKDGTVVAVRQTDVGIRTPKGELLAVVTMLEPLSSQDHALNNAPTV